MKTLLIVWENGDGYTLYVEDDFILEKREDWSKWILLVEHLIENKERCDLFCMAHARSVHLREGDVVKENEQMDQHQR